MRDLIFMGDSRESLGEFPDAVKQEIVSPHRKETYRAVYALKLGTRIYVLQAFQKKSKHGIKTPRPDLELIEARYKAAKRLEEDNV